MSRTTKKCFRCKKTKLRSEFWDDPARKDGKHYLCILCGKAYNKEYRLSERGKDCDRKHGLKRNFGMTIETYDHMFEEQNGVCAICGGVEVRTFKGALVRLAVDHDHKTGKIRRLLCYRCNSVLGFVNDDISLLSKCVKYLKKYKPIVA